MGYGEAWKVLADLITELRKKGEIIPPHVMNDLRSAKTMIQILKADPTHLENLPRIETYLESVESSLVFMMQEKFGSSYVEQWIKKLEEARRAPEEEEEAAPRFVPGLPRGKHWVRVQVSEDAQKNDIKRLAKENKLSSKMQKNGYMLVYGDIENVKLFVKKMAKKLQVERKR
ncbi:MAG: DUF2096 domain-containing protein [Candidatus Bathyarchaeota archaeon]|nr:DUF2096 domain-containing protein [Candidatus Bathyarchaeota archaeon]MDH5532016.1 DUF2096 domain-containing protein [Candidatus Bathyarchaeota archaeon]MDH5712449.1 DUF2096 domain-containing protein [Candidatus Bathyarchaeota archaeon]